MNAATIKVLDDMILGDAAKSLVVALAEPATMLALCVMLKKLGHGKMIDECEKATESAISQHLNIVRYALSSCDIPLRRQEELVKQIVRQVTVLFVGYVDKISKGEPIDEEHAEFLKDKAAVEAAESPADKLRAFADMLDKRGGMSAARGKYSA